MCNKAHKEIQFEVWLTGQNKQVQKKYWQLLKEAGRSKYHIPSTPQDFIAKNVLVDSPDFNKLDSLTKQIEIGVMKFIKDVTDAVE